MFNDIVAVFANFLILRIYVPGLLFVMILQTLHASRAPFTTLLTIKEFQWVMIPLVIGQCFHLVSAAISLICGFEQVKNKKEYCIPPWIRLPGCIRERMQGWSVYGKAPFESAKITFHFAQLYLNCFLAFATLAWIIKGSDPYRPRAFWIILLFAICSLISSIINHWYGRAILVELCKPGAGNKK
jgi:hypothetical protein